VVRGKTVVITTTNGTRALLKAIGAEPLYVAALNNAAATARALACQARGDVVLVGSGTEGRVSWEDSFTAGAIVERLIALGGRATPEAAGPSAAGDGGDAWRLTDSALIALELWRAVKGDVASALRRGRGGWNVMKHHLDDAFDACGAVDSIGFAARLHKQPLEIVVEPV
jgi:2-phosphosulfolactate phosphatase